MAVLTAAAALTRADCSPPPDDRAAYGQVSLALANLRGVFILILLSFHASLAYLASTKAGATAFDKPPYPWLAFPVVDERRFFGFDLYSAWVDVHVMALMFFLSGLFVAASLRRKGAARFAADRLWRLGPPFLFGLFVLSPLAIYPVFIQLNPGADFADYLAAYHRLPFLPNGPQWFLWMLLAMSLAVAALYALAPRAFDALAAVAGGAQRRPQVFLLALAAALVVAYLPPALAYGPFDWFEDGPFSFQKSRPLLYAVFFLGGVAVGAAGLGQGLLAPDGALTRQWRRLGALSPAMLFLWMGLTGVTLGFPAFAPMTMRVLSSLAYVGASVAGVVLLLALSVRYCAKPIGWLALFSHNSLGIFVLHYVPLVWMQYLLSGVAAPALVKAPLVFGVMLGLSLAVSMAMRSQPALAWLIGEDAGVRARAPRP